MTLTLKKQGHITNHAFMVLIYYCTMFLFWNQWSLQSIISVSPVKYQKKVPS